MAAWRPAVPGITEVLHARFVGHAYPRHTHDTWTLLVVDDGAIRFDLERREHVAERASVVLLPPHVAHTGQAMTAGGFRKRVVYLDAGVLGDDLVGAAVATPIVAGGRLGPRLGRLHEALAEPGEELEVESRLALIARGLRDRLRPPPARSPVEPRLAGALRELLDERITPGLSLREAGDLLGAHPDHLVRAFTAAFGLPPHRYLTSRRIDAARRRLLDGQPVAAVAAAVGFCDQAHLTRHFTRQLGTTPARYARAAAR